MKTRPSDIVHASAVAVLFLLVFVTLTPAQYDSQIYVPGELLVKVSEGASESYFSRFVRLRGAVIADEIKGTRWKRIRLDRRMSVRSALASFASDELIAAVQPNYIYRLEAVPDDTRFPELYGLSRISAPDAWDLTTGSAGTVVAVIDTGIKYDHEDLSGNVWTNPGEIPGNGTDDDGNGFVDDVNGYDFFFDDPDPADEHGHGTHVAGIIGAVGNNALGVAGVNWNVSLMAIKIYDSSGRGSTSAMLVNAYNYVRMMRLRGVNIRVTNNSYGGCDEACGFDLATKEALDALGEAGVLNVFAAGNSNRNIDTAPFYPGSYDLPTILTVAASDSSDKRAAFSNFGAASVDIAAPGVGILSTVRTGTGYGALSGTSMASPHVAGAAALLSSYNPALDPYSLKATLMNRGDKLKSWDTFVGAGARLNISAALNAQTVCGYSLSESDLNARTKGGVFTVNVSAPPNCGFSVKSNARWLIPLDSRYFAGSGKVRFRVTVNPTITRTGSISIGGKVLTVRQSRR